jgi:cell division protein FtsA
MSRPVSINASRGRKLASKRPSIVSVLDVGSSKVTCIIARLRPRNVDNTLPNRSHAIEVLGIGYQRARGIKAGAIVDLDAAEQTIRLAVDAAEKMAKVTIESLIVNVSCGRLASEAYSANIGLNGKAVGETEIGRVLAVGRAHAHVPGRTVIHSRPIAYSLDGNRGIGDPRGMVGTHLGVDMHVVRADEAPLRNLELCINRSHLSIETMVAGPFASALSVLVDDESELGAVVIDFGAGTTTMSVFADGEFVHADAIALGGRTVTTDLARGLSVAIEDAERIKTMHGSAVGAVSDEHEFIDVALAGDGEHDVPDQIPRSTITRIIRARVEEMLELVRDRLNASGFASVVGRRMVLTGGGSQLTGMAEIARRILTRNVRLGRPLGVSGLPEAAKGPAFASAVGLLIYPQVAEFEQLAHAPAAQLQATGTGYFARVGRWLKQSF